MKVKRNILNCALMCVLLAGLAWAQETPNKNPESTPQNLIAENNAAPTLHDATEPDNEQGVVPTSALPAEVLKIGKIAAKYDQYNPWDWLALPYPSRGDTLDPELGGIRAAMAKHGLSLGVYTQTNFFDNLANPPMYGALGLDANGKWHDATAGTTTTYWGQRPTYNFTVLADLTWSNLRTNTQFDIEAGTDATNASAVFLQDSPRISAMYMNQYLFRKRLLLNIGYSVQGWHYVGIFAGGQLAGSPLGNSSILQSVAGEPSPAATTPGIMARWMLSKYAYSMTDVQTAAPVNPNGVPVLADKDIWHMPLFWKSPYGHSRALISQEFGYNRPSAPGVPHAWFRGDIIYNFSHLYLWTNDPFSSSKPQLSHGNYAISFAGDYQTHQIDKVLPFRGNYLGATAQFVPSQQNAFSSYFELRDYVVGPFRKRPMDFASIIINQIGFSPNAENYFQKNFYTFNEHLKLNQQNYAIQYIFHAKQGVYVTNSFEFTENPSFATRMPNSFLYCAGVTIFL